MKVDIYSWENYDGQTCQALYIDGKYSTSVYPLCECPEDAIIGRDLKDCDDLAHYMKKGYELAKSGDTLEIEYHDVDEEPNF